jgi:hypothetical protein
VAGASRRRVVPDVAAVFRGRPRRRVAGVAPPSSPVASAFDPVASTVIGLPLVGCSGQCSWSGNNAVGLMPGAAWPEVATTTAALAACFRDVAVEFDAEASRRGAGRLGLEATTVFFRGRDRGRAGVAPNSAPAIVRPGTAALRGTGAAAMAWWLWYACACGGTASSCCAKGAGDGGGAELNWANMVYRSSSPDWSPMSAMTEGAGAVDCRFCHGLWRCCCC